LNVENIGWERTLQLKATCQNI